MRVWKRKLVDTEKVKFCVLKPLLVVEAVS